MSEDVYNGRQSADGRGDSALVLASVCQESVDSGWIWMYHPYQLPAVWTSLSHRVHKARDVTPSNHDEALVRCWGPIES